MMRRMFTYLSAYAAISPAPPLAHLQRAFWYLMWRWLGIYAFTAKFHFGLDIPRIIGPYTLDEAQQLHERLHGKG